MNRLNIEDSIINIKGIGEKTLPSYEKLGINTVDDLIHYYPRNYIRYEKISSSNDFKVNEVCAFRAFVSARPLTKRIRHLNITSVSLVSDGVLITATWFRMPFLSQMLTAGKCYVFRGKLTGQGDHYHIEQAQIFSEQQYEEIEDKIAPVYSLTKGLSNNAISKSVKNAFEYTDKEQYEDDLYEMHFPTDAESLYRVRQKLVFDEFLLFVLRLRLLRGTNEQTKNNFNMIEVAQTNRLIEKLPYSLTSAQLRVWEEVKNDLCSSYSMSRLVQGDVGCGKTIIAILAAVMTACNGYQAAVMAPTEILATQHFELFCKIIKDNNLDIPVVLLTGSVSESKKKVIRKQILDSEIKIIIGTHALIQEKVEYSNLALVVTDEQHRFGVCQRESLAQKNLNDSVHVLVMSATPIPRTLAIILYGDLHVSVIDEVPAHKLPIKNAVVGEKYRKKAYELIENEIRAGRQCYIICPLVEESEGLSAKDVISHTEHLQSVFPDDIRIGCLYGKMKPKDKQKVMDDFADNNIQILVSTTVVEVGVNVPNATVMLVEDADRFGLATLHQLRGRIGRGEYQSYCIFMSSSDSKKTMERLEILRKTNDGFKIAQEDFKQRGPGDLFGIRQSGDMQFKLADIYTDSSLLQSASIKADNIMKEDPLLQSDKYSYLRKQLNKSVWFYDVEKTI